MELESAIPAWLKTERTLSAKTPPGFKPPFELYTSRFPRDTKDLTLAVIGAQYAARDVYDGQAVETISSYVTSDIVDVGSRPGFFEVAAETDMDGFYNIAVLAYWPSRVAFEEWSTTSGFHKWWATVDREVQQQQGWFLEVFFPTIERFETVFSTTVPEGAAHMRESISGPIQEHVYWGSMRDRLPISQVDSLDKQAAYIPCGELSSKSREARQRVRISGTRNLAVIRSGQDWSATIPEERNLYLGSMHPTLAKGMQYLRDNGDEVGCISCRFMDIVDPVNLQAKKDRTFGLAYFDCLGSLESWSKSHPTHIAIFGEFAKYAKKLGDKMSLRLFHEVLVLEPEQQLFEYINCHRRTGMLNKL